MKIHNMLAFAVLAIFSSQIMANQSVEGLQLAAIVKNQSPPKDNTETITVKVKVDNKSYYNYGPKNILCKLDSAYKNAKVIRDKDKVPYNDSKKVVELTFEAHSTYSTHMYGDMTCSEDSPAQTVLFKFHFEFTIATGKSPGNQKAPIDLKSLAADEVSKTHEFKNNTMTYTLKVNNQ